MSTFDIHEEFIGQFSGELFKSGRHFSETNSPKTFSFLQQDESVDFSIVAFLGANRKPLRKTMESLSLSRSDLPPSLSAKLESLAGTRLEETGSPSYEVEEADIWPAGWLPTPEPCGDPEGNEHFHCSTVGCSSASLAASIIDIDLSCSSYRPQIILAYCILLETWDIAYDTFQFFGYSTAQFEEYLFRLLGYEKVLGVWVPWKIEFFCEWATCDLLDSDHFVAHGELLLHNIVFNASYWKGMYHYYRDLAPSETKKKYCLLSQMAVVIFHEILHMALHIVGASREETRVREIENHFMYYLLKRLCVLGYEDRTGLLISCVWPDAWNVLVCNETTRQECQTHLLCRELGE